MTNSAPSFDAEFRGWLETLIAWRRDVRRFSVRPVPPDVIDHLLDVAQLAPSVGNSQPWRWVRVESPGKRAEIRANFLDCNDKARQAQPDRRADAYAALKLAGSTVRRCNSRFSATGNRPGSWIGPSDHAGNAGIFGGRHDHQFLADGARRWTGRRLAVDPRTGPCRRRFGSAPSWNFVAYLCVGWPEEEHLDPELERYGWQDRSDAGGRSKSYEAFGLFVVRAIIDCTIRISLRPRRQARGA